eukprot:GAFH01004721.1.p2 GENE.GAFH01004721.1~~GAFH01004721.1.p2  ORF type:complete len:198 (-),score=13.69 GAFH01004721.1:101-694(-)
MHAYRVELEYSGPGSGGSPFKRETIVISAFGPDTPNDTLVEITTLSQPRREGRIPRFHLGDVPKEDDARYLKGFTRRAPPVRCSCCWPWTRAEAARAAEEETAEEAHRRAAEEEAARRRAAETAEEARRRAAEEEAARGKAAEEEAARRRAAEEEAARRRAAEEEAAPAGQPKKRQPAARQPKRRQPKKPAAGQPKA